MALFSTRGIAARIPVTRLLQSLWQHSSGKVYMAGDVGSDNQLELWERHNLPPTFFALPPSPSRIHSNTWDCFEIYLIQSDRQNFWILVLLNIFHPLKTLSYTNVLTSVEPLNVFSRIWRFNHQNASVAIVVELEDQGLEWLKSKMGHCRLTTLAPLDQFSAS